MVDDGVLQTVRRVPQVLQLGPDLRQHLLVVGDLIEASGRVLGSMTEARQVTESTIHPQWSVVARISPFFLYLETSQAQQLRAVCFISDLTGDRQGWQIKATSWFKPV